MLCRFVVRFYVIHLLSFVNYIDLSCLMLGSWAIAFLGMIYLLPNHSEIFFQFKVFMCVFISGKLSVILFPNIIFCPFCFLLHLSLDIFLNFFCPPLPLTSFIIFSFILLCCDREASLSVLPSNSLILPLQIHPVYHWDNLLMVLSFIFYFKWLYFSLPRFQICSFSNLSVPVP